MGDLHPINISVYEKPFETSDIMSDVLELCVGHFHILPDIIMFFTKPALNSLAILQMPEGILQSVMSAGTPLSGTLCSSRHIEYSKEK